MTLMDGSVIVPIYLYLINYEECKEVNICLSCKIWHIYKIKLIRNSMYGVCFARFNRQIWALKKYYLQSV